MTIEEIKEFVQGELSYLNLSTKEKNTYIQFIKKMDNYYQTHNMENANTKSVFMNKLEDCIEFFKLQGFDEETSLVFAKKTIPSYDRKSFKNKLAFLRAINLEEGVVMHDSLSLRFNLEKAHARKKYLVDINNKEAQTRNFLIHDGDTRVKKRFNVEMNKLLKEYPLTKETMEVWMIIATMNDQKFEDFFKLTREELSYIYPTTKEELATLHLIATMSNEEIIEKYGITRQELLQKHPLNKDTLNAIRSIHQSSDNAVEKTFHKSKQEILKLRTLTTDMIKVATKENITLKRKTYTKEELLEKFKTMKKGTYPNG